MTSITIDLEDKDLEDLDIHTSHLSLHELDEKLKVRRIRKTVSEMHAIALRSEGYNLDEGEIFSMVNEIKKSL